MAKDYDIQQKIEALGIDLREVQKILHETGSELQRAEKELCDADEALASFEEKEAALANKFDPMPEEPTPSRIPTRQTDLKQPSKRFFGNVTLERQVSTVEHTGVDNKFEAPSVYEDENIRPQNLVHN